MPVGEIGGINPLGQFPVAQVHGQRVNPERPIEVERETAPVAPPEQAPPPPAVQAGGGAGAAEAAAVAGAMGV